MKSIKYFLLAGVFLAFTACEDALDLSPEQSLNIPVAFTNEASTFASLLGVYSLAQDLDAMGGLTAVISDYMADNTRFVGSFPTLQEINNYATIASNTSIRSIWADNYKIILAANAVIQNVPNVDDPLFTAAERAQFIAEAKFMRALTNLNLVTLFGQPFTYQNGNTPGIPIVLTPNLLNVEEPLRPARNTVAEVYAQIQKDLTEAVADLPASYSSADQTRGRATKGAANGLLSRVALYKGEYAQAASFADEVLNNTALYSLASDYTFYDGNTSEDVFSIQMTATDNSRTGAGGWASYHLPAARGGRGDVTFSQALLDAFDQANDRRFTTLTFVGNNAGGVSATFINKFDDGATNTDNSPILRVTEMVLNKAEGLVRSTNSVNQTAIDLINQLRARAGLSAYSASDFANADALADAILMERWKELCFEGHRRMDLLRLGRPLRTTGAGAGISSPGDTYVVLPIPQREIDLGSSLPQNAGY